jgi:uncharacterized HAD superfamily protein
MSKAKQTGNPSYRNFLLQEYKELVQAHFESIRTISSFFRHYLLIMSIPFSSFAIFKFLPGTMSLSKLIQDYYQIFNSFFFSIFLIGVGVLCYVINLRMDAILYARTVNGIRKYFYDISEEDTNTLLRTRILPQTAHLPYYLEKGGFSPLVFVFGVINSLYLSLFMYINNLYYVEQLLLLSCGGFIFALLLQFAIYWKYCKIRETDYLKCFSIGIDIDGVLNKQCEHFCEYFTFGNGKRLTAKQITYNPIHEHPKMKGKISEEDTKKVFNNPGYWVTLPPVENVDSYINKIRNALNFKIYIFTYRPWPRASKGSDAGELNGVFLRNCTRFTLRDRILQRLNRYAKIRPMDQITKEWLIKHGIKYDKLIIEKGNADVADPKGKFVNRFRYSNLKKIKFFVEDDIEKAVKLSFICDIVFLINQPHNDPKAKLPKEIKEFRKNIPSNILRVNGWQDIYRLIKRFS